MTDRQPSAVPARVRTCVGCRQRAPVSELLRVVAVQDPSGPDPLGVRVVPDPRRRRPGRGAHVHPDLGCVDLAERRRAFARALRVPGPLDAELVRGHLAQAERE